MTNAVTAFAGWNSSTQGWGESTWGNSVIDTAFSATSALTGVTVIFNAQSAPVGQVAVARVTGVTVEAGTGVSVAVAGLGATAQLGTVLVWGRISPAETATWTEMVVN
tara:strand:- start:1171 stop:1494 length:324 start_codon:yes stop_codon:yes gene_type:complete